jgi:hypothetical protein
MIREREISCDRHLTNLKVSCSFALAHETCGDSAVVRGHCREHEGGDVLIGLAVIDAWPPRAFSSKSE